MKIDSFFLEHYNFLCFSDSLETAGATNKKGRSVEFRLWAY